MHTQSHMQAHVHIHVHMQDSIKHIVKEKHRITGKSSETSRRHNFKTKTYERVNESITRFPPPDPPDFNVVVAARFSRGGSVRSSLLRPLSLFVRCWPLPPPALACGGGARRASKQEVFSRDLHACTCENGDMSTMQMCVVICVLFVDLGNAVRDVRSPRSGPAFDATANDCVVLFSVCGCTFAHVPPRSEIEQLQRNPRNHRYHTY